MALLGEALQTALEQYVRAIEVSDRAPRASFAKQLQFLEQRFGRAGAAAKIGVSDRTLRRWAAGTSKPGNASVNRVGTAFRNEKSGPVRRLRQAREAKRRLHDATLYLLGTITTSSKTSLLRNPLDGGLRGDWSALWPIRRSRAKLTDKGGEIIQNLSDVPGVMFLDDDVEATFG